MRALRSGGGPRSIALGLLAVALGAGALSWRLLPHGHAGRPPPASIGMDTPLGATEVSADIEQLIRDYLVNERAADEKYRFKTIAIAGVLLDIDRQDPQITTVLVGKQLGSKESPCACQGGRALEQAAARLSPGQSLTVRGKMVGLEQMRMVLLNCEIVASPLG